MRIGFTECAVAGAGAAATVLLPLCWCSLQLALSKLMHNDLNSSLTVAFNCISKWLCSCSYVLRISSFGLCNSSFIANEFFFASFLYVIDSVY